MKPSIICLLFAIITVNCVFAGSGNPSKVDFPESFTATLKEGKWLFETAVSKVCACQILRVSSRNENEQLIAVFAQGTNNGDIVENFVSAGIVLEKEKKHLKSFFYSKIKTAANLHVATECSQLYKNIQLKYTNIKLYDVLDADALNNKLLASK